VNLGYAPFYYKSPRDKATITMSEFNAQKNRPWFTTRRAVFQFHHNGVGADLRVCPQCTNCPLWKNAMPGAHRYIPCVPRTVRLWM